MLLAVLVPMLAPTDQVLPIAAPLFPPGTRLSLARDEKRGKWIVSIPAYPALVAQGAQTHEGTAQSATTPPYALRLVFAESAPPVEEQGAAMRGAVLFPLLICVGALVLLARAARA